MLKSRYSVTLSPEAAEWVEESMRLGKGQNRKFSTEVNEILLQNKELYPRLRRQRLFETIFNGIRELMTEWNVSEEQMRAHCERAIALKA